MRTLPPRHAIPRPTDDHTPKPPPAAPPALKITPLDARALTIIPFDRFIQSAAQSRRLYTAAKCHVNRRVRRLITSYPAR